MFNKIRYRLDPVFRAKVDECSRALEAWERAYRAWDQVTSPAAPRWMVKNNAECLVQAWREFDDAWWALPDSLRASDRHLVTAIEAITYVVAKTSGLEVRNDQ